MVYRIGEVAKLLHVSTESLCSWEKQGLIPKPVRRPSNHREYTEQDIKAIQDYLNKRKKREEGKK